ncbi:hypothetical protein B0H13DRAFT_2346268 [Mycena leptocephala]|nr:hypothetical protein B0H13DRAFT_2346268 [Mycena leptocephala]
MELFSRHISPSKQRKLNELLRSHSTPLDPSQFKSTAASCRQDAAVYGKEIARLQRECSPTDLSSYIAKLYDISAALNTYAERCRSLFSPIRRVPPEILLEILELLSPAREKFSDTSSVPASGSAYRASIHHLLQFSQVCWRWRSVTGMPSLWTRMDLDLDEWSQCDTQLLRLALERSANLPLKIQVRALHNVEDGHVLTLLAEHSNRWQTASFTMLPSSFRWVLRAQGGLRSLTTLEIWMPPGIHPPPEMQWPSQIFEIAPSLTNLSSSASIWPTVPWHSTRLKSFGCHVSRAEDVQDALSSMARCSGWTSCTLHLSTLATPPTITTPPVEFNTRQFEVRTNTRQSLLGNLLSSVTFASLERLGLMVPRVAFPSSHFLNFAPRSSLSTSLETLSLMVRVTDHDLLRCLASLRSLKGLWVRDIGRLRDVPEYVVITDHFLHGLATAITSLNCLELTSHLKFKDESLIEFVAPRAGTTRIRLHCFPGARIIDETALRQLHNYGVAVLG